MMDAIDQLEALLTLPGDEPGWLRAVVGPLPAGATGGTAASAEVPTVVSTLRAALVAGLGTRRQHPVWLASLGQALDEVETGMVVFGGGGADAIARNAYLDELLEEEPAGDRLLELVARHAQRAAAAGPEGGVQQGEIVELPGGIYRLVATRAPAGTLVLVDRMSSRLPTTRELRLSFGLRGREPQVALLAAEGLSNAAIAVRLRLSAHTVRHYLERVLDRLGLHTRKALALHLMAGNGERPEPPERRTR